MTGSGISWYDSMSVKMDYGSNENEDMDTMDVRMTMESVSP